MVVATAMSSLTLQRPEQESLSSVSLPTPSSVGTDISTSSSSSSGSSSGNSDALTIHPASSSAAADGSGRHQQQHQEDNESLDSPSLEGDEQDNHHLHEDPSHWIDIDPMTAGNNNNNNNSNSNNGSSSANSRWGRPQAAAREEATRSSSPIIKLQIPSLLCDLVTFFWDWTYAAIEVWMEVLSAPPFPLETLQKVSIVLLGVERIRDNIDQSTLIVFVNPIDGTPIGSVGGGGGDAAAAAAAAGADATAANGAGYYFTLASVPHYLIWGIPGLLALLSISFVLTLQLSWGHQEEAVIATALILLIFLEALLPLFILGCTSMFLFQQVSWETGLVLLIIVWLGSTFCAHCIRRMLYQSLGHG